MSFVSANDNVTNNELHNIDYDNSVVLTNDFNQMNKDKNSNSFNDVQILINNSINNEINLEKDYEYHEGDKPINIHKSIIINGNNHIIDAKNKSKIFNIQADNVIIKNITFMNANGNQENDDYIKIHQMPVDGYDDFKGVVYNSEDFYDTIFKVFYYSAFRGGAIYCNGNNLTIVNSSFVNNSASCGGGIYIDGANAQLINLIFFNNTADEGGAIFNRGKNTFILNSQFDLNHALYNSHSICSYNDINIQMCNFTNSSQMSIFYAGNWQINNMTSTYFNSFIKFGYINFKFNLTHIKNDFYNLEITFRCNHYGQALSGCIIEDIQHCSVNKKFCLNINGEIYNLQTDSNSQANLYLNLSNGFYNIEVYNPITKLSLSKSFNVSDSIELNKTGDTNVTLINKIPKVFPKVIAMNKVFNKKTKIKKYTITLKNKSKAIKNVWVTLKIKGKTFKAKTNNKGQVTFKITKLNRKGKYKAKIIFKGDKYYSSANKNVKIVVK